MSVYMAPMWSVQADPSSDVPSAALILDTEKKSVRQVIADMGSDIAMTESVTPVPENVITQSISEAGDILGGLINAGVANMLNDVGDPQEFDSEVAAVNHLFDEVWSEV